MKCVQVVTEFVRNTPLEPDMLDQLADACLDALHREAPFVALGPVASVDYERCAVEIECTIQSEAADDSDLEAKMQRVKDVMRDALMAAEYETSVERIAVPAQLPDADHISTSFVERSNLTMRMSMRRFTRLTNAFSKKVENLTAAVSLHFAYYNFCRVHQTLGTTPAVAAGIADHVWKLDELIGLLEAAEATPVKRGPYKKRGSKSMLTPNSE